MSNTEEQIGYIEQDESCQRKGSVEFTELWNPDSDGDSARTGPAALLLRSGDISSNQLTKANEYRIENPHLTIIDALAEIGAISQGDAYMAVAEYFALPYTRISSPEVDKTLVDHLGIEFAKSKNILPIRQDGDTTIIGTANPADMFLIEDVGKKLGTKTRLIVVPPCDIHKALEELSVSPCEQVNEFIKDIAEDTVEVVEGKSEEVADLELAAGESPVIRYVNFLISSAVREDASDIHVEPNETKLRVRFRIDGMLFEQPAPPISMHAAIISRLKIMANMDISERRLPQDGRIRATVRGMSIDLRVSTLPLTTGEKCVIRILDNRSISVGLESLGMRKSILAQFKDQILQPHGIVLVTGPTGSGKSTTLYSGLQIMDGQTLNISTVEDPVEYELDFANQVNVHDSIGMSFEAALRSLLRQDPDVIMIGEIRDEKTSRIAIQASLTGHMVLSTLHTNDAPSSITRMINIGIEPFLIAAAVNGVLAQRLVRRICSNCKENIEVTDAMKETFAENKQEATEAFHGKGCDQCRQTGYKGRTGIYELLCFNDELRDLVTESPTLGDLRRASINSGMETLRFDGLTKIASAQTTIEEIMRVTEA